MKQFTISPNESGQRFDKYLKKLLSNASGSFVYKMLRKKNITLNDRKADGTEKLNAGDLVKLFLSDETFEKFSGKDETNSGYMKLKSIDSGRLQVVYEDDDVIIINKPSGMLSQKAVPEDISANEYILSYLIRKGALSEEQFKTFKPSICNRLDRNTSGLLIAGKTLKGLQTMAEALKKRTVQKYYRCIVKGELREKTHLKGYLSKDEQNNKVKVVSHIRPEEKADYLWLKKNAPDLKIGATIHPNMRVCPRNSQEKVLAIGQKAAYFSGTEHFVNMVEGGGLHGYDGICELCLKIQEAYQTKKDTRDLIVRKGLGCESCV